MFTLNELRAKWGQTIDKMQDLVDVAKKAKRSLTKEEEKKFAELEAEESKISEEVKRLEKVDMLQLERSRPTSKPVVMGGDYDKESNSRGLIFTSKDGKEIRALTRNEKITKELNSELSFGRAVRSWITGDWASAPKEARALSTQTGSLGGWLVPSSLSEQVIDLARSKSVCLQAGALTLPMDTAQVTLVKVASDPTPYWRAENTAITESTPTFAPVILNALACGVLIRLPLELIRDAENSAFLIEDLISKTIALELDRKMLLGSGISEPRGLNGTPGVQVYSLGINGAVPTNYDAYSHAVQLIATENGEAKSAIAHPRTWGTLDRLKDQQLQPMQAPKSYQDLQKLSTTSVPVNQTQGSSTDASTAFVGDFSNMILGVRNSLQLEASQHASDAFSKMQVLIRGFVRVDVAVIRPSHFTKITGIRA